MDAANDIPPTMTPSIVLDNLPLQTEIEQIANRLPIQAKDLMPNAADLTMVDFIKRMHQTNDMQNAVVLRPTERVRNFNIHFSFIF